MWKFWHRSANEWGLNKALITKCRNVLGNMSVSWRTSLCKSWRKQQRSTRERIGHMSWYLLVQVLTRMELCEFHLSYHIRLLQDLTGSVAAPATAAQSLWFLHFFLCFVNTKIDSLNTLLCITLGRWITPVTSININTFLLSLHAPVRRLLSQRSFSNTLWKWHTRPELLACRINSEWPSLHLPLCVCVTFHRGHGIRWWVPGNPIYLQAESRNIWMHSCQRHRHRCPDCRHHRQLWVHCLRLKKTQKTINK